MEKFFELNNNGELQALFGKYDANLKLIEEELGIKIIRQNNGLKLVGSEDKADRAYALLGYLLDIISSTKVLKKRDIIYALRLAGSDRGVDFQQLAKRKVDVAAQGIVITPKTAGQMEYIEAIKHYDIVFGLGPAGTGKTYLAVAMAVNALKKGLVRRIILTRPAVEAAGENLGYLPGTMVEKVLPFLRPLYDAIYDMVEPERVDEYTEKGVIEVAPLAFMRGRTLNDAFIILDEAQNCTPEQIKMFLTRLGFDSKTVITGDLTQSDLPGGIPIGLLHVQEVLKEIQEIKFIYLTGEDVVRHELVQQIIEAYEKSSKK